MRLSKNETIILNYLKSSKTSTAQELVKETKLNYDGVKRSIFFLQEKGLVTMQTDKKNIFYLTSQGEQVLEKGFEEEKVINYKGEEVSILPEEVKKYLWLLKELKMIDLKSGKVQILDEKYKLKEMLKGLLRDEDIDKRYVNVLKSRNLVDEKLHETITAKITPKGLQEVADSGDLIKLTSQIIKNKSWKEKSFRPYNIKKDIPSAKSGKVHPLTMAIKRIKQVFLSLGFSEMDGTHIESCFWNFDALFQPQDHPARDLADTFYIKNQSKEKIPKSILDSVRSSHEKGWHYKWDLNESKKLVLRTHTTVLSARELAKNKQGKFFAIGRVFRNEAVDYKHLAEFHQVEGILAWKKSNFSNLLWILKEFYKRLGFEKIRFRPSYFPYTEPSVEIEVFFDEKNEWVELGGAGIFRKEMVEPLGSEYPVLAWGLSLERPLMLMLGLNDVRTFYTNKSRWLDNISYGKIFGVKK